MLTAEGAMSAELQRLARRLAEDGAKTAEFFNGLVAEDWAQQVYRTGSKWTVRDILAHFVSAERSFRELLNDIMHGGKGAPRNLDIIEFNEEAVPALHALSPQDLQLAFSEAREGTIEIAASMTAADLDKVGYHPWFGDVDLRSMVKLVYRHNMIHLRDIRRALKDRAPVEHVDISPPSSKM
jgi:hypothetical protein